MPWVTVPTRPSGGTDGDHRVADREPGRRPDRRHHGFATSTLTTARSVFGSRPTIRAGARVPSAKTASSRLPAPLAAGGDDVVVGQHVAVALDDDPGARSGLLADADLQRHDGGHGARRDVGHRSRRPFLALRDRGQPGPGLGEPRGAVRRQPPDEPAGRADEQRERPEDRERPTLHPAAEQDLPQAQPGALTARRRCAAPPTAGGGPRAAVLAGSRHGSSAPDQSAGSTGGGVRAGVRRPLQRGAVTRRAAEGQRERGGGRGGQRGSVGQSRAGRAREGAGHAVGRPKPWRTRHRPAGRSSGRGTKRGPVPFDPASDHRRCGALGRRPPAGRAQASPSVALTALPRCARSTLREALC
jgi:hypothetical protein